MSGDNGLGLVDYENDATEEVYDGTTAREMLLHIESACPDTLRTAYHEGVIKFRDIVDAAKLHSSSPLVVPFIDFALDQPAFLALSTDEADAWKELQDSFSDNLEIAEQRAREEEAVAREEAAAQAALEEEAARAAREHQRAEEKRLAEDQRRRKLFADVEAKRKEFAARRSQLSVPRPPPPALSPSPAAVSPALPPPAFSHDAPAVSRRVVAPAQPASPSSVAASPKQESPTFEVTLDQPRPALPLPHLYSFQPADISFLDRPLSTPVADVFFHQEDAQDASWTLAAAQGTATTDFPDTKPIFACVFNDHYLGKLPPPRCDAFLRLLSALRRASFREGAQGSSLVLGSGHTPYARTVGDDADLRQHAAPRSDKNYGAQAATTRALWKDRWGTSLEAARGQKDSRVRDDNSAGGRGDRESGHGVNAREDRRHRDKNSRHERRSRSRSRSPEGNRGSRRESGRGHQQRGQEERKFNRGNR